jgi:hypothetical protein
VPAIGDVGDLAGGRRTHEHQPVAPRRQGKQVVDLNRDVDLREGLGAEGPFGGV